VADLAAPLLCDANLRLSAFKGNRALDAKLRLSVLIG